MNLWALSSSFSLLAFCLSTNNVGFWHSQEAAREIC